MGEYNEYTYVKDCLDNGRRFVLWTYSQESTKYRTRLILFFPKVQRTKCKYKRQSKFYLSQLDIIVMKKKYTINIICLYANIASSYMVKH